MDQQEVRYRKNRKWLAILGLAGLLAVLALTAAASVPLVRFASQPEQFRLWIEDQGIWGSLAFAGMVMIQVVLALIPGEPFEIAAGYAFGAWEGTVLYLAAATAGSLLVFFLVRRFGRPLAQAFFPEKRLDTLRFLKTSPRRELLFLLIFMLPGVPKDLMCYYAGLTDIRLPVWLVICSLGRIPSVITSTVGGDALVQQNYFFAAGVFAAAFLVSGVGLWIFHRVCDREGQEDAE